MNPIVPLLLFIMIFGSIPWPAKAQGQRGPWERHVIDNTSTGADGVRVADVNNDGNLDLVSGWEEGGLVRVYLHPGQEEVTRPWPAVTVGKVGSPEDAVLVDLDQDGVFDVISSTEADTRTIFVHRAPEEPDSYLQPDAWATEPVPATIKQQQWMFALPMDVDGKNGIDLVVGSKNENASIGWLESPENPRDLDRWRFHRLYDAGWIMSLEAADLDQDGDLDVVASDRKGPDAGVLWLENPGPQAIRTGANWPVHRIGGNGREVMFLDVVDIDRDGRDEILAAVKPAEILLLRQNDSPVEPWQETYLVLDSSRIGTAKAVRAGDLDLDGRIDLVFSCEHAHSPRSGVVRVILDSTSSKIVEMQDISGPEGTKFDLIQLIDVDNDSDLDVVTCEEADGLGLFWYENPTLRIRPKTILR